MSLSYYYTARRATPLTDAERAGIKAIEEKFSVEDQIEKRSKTGKGPNWESLCIYDPSDPSEPGIIFEGATKLPDNSEKALEKGFRHWTAALTEIRRILPDAEWSLFLDDVEIPWDDQSQEWNPWAAEG